MANKFCPNCGKEMHEQAAFCSSCGYAFNTAVQPAPMQQAAVQPAPMQQAPVQSAPMQQAAVQPAPMQQAAVQPAPMQQAAIQPAPMQQAAVQQSPDQPAPVVCAKCGNQIINPTSVCPECGASIGSVKICAVCGKLMFKNDAFCRSCQSPADSLPAYSESAAFSALQPSYQGGTATAVAYREEENAPAKKKSSAKKIIIIISAIVLAVLVAAAVFVFMGHKSVSIDHSWDGCKGLYYGETTLIGNVPDGQGTWMADLGENVSINASGEWKNGGLYNGTVTLKHKGKELGEVAYTNGKWDEDDYQRLFEAAAEAEILDIIVSALG